MKLLRRQYLTLCLLVTTTFINSHALAEPWIESGDERSRHHLQVLADAGLIKLPLNTWPLMWTGVNRELDAIDRGRLGESELRSYQYLKQEQRRSKQRVSAGQDFAANTSLPGLTDFATDSREQLESRTYATYEGGHWAGKLQGSIVGDAIDGQRYRLDGSYVAGMLGNWAVGVGAIDRWWGPGWQHGLIMSHNARPSPGVFINRIDNKAFKLPILKWLGPWDLRFFTNRLESDRATPRAKLFGMRVNFKPFKRFEIGFSRSAQWGGEGRPEDFTTFRDMVFGYDNTGKYGITEENEPGNQLGGGDWRLSHRFGDVSTAFYGEVIGEDERNHHPLKMIAMAGLEASFLWGSAQTRLALEVSNTTMEFDESGGTVNTAYEHHLYPSGYRHRGRPIGASTDNDSEFYMLKGFHFLPQGHQINWSVGSGNINWDGTGRRPPGGNVFGNEKVDLLYASAQYAMPLGDQSELTIGGQYYSNGMEIRGEPVETGVYLIYKFRL